MGIKKALHLLTLPFLCLLLVSYTAAAVSIPRNPSPTVATSHSPAVSPAPSAPAPTLTITPTPTPSATMPPTPTPTPSPTPTPAPDPWAEHFTDAGAWVTVADQDKGPWSYRDAALSVSIEKRKLGSVPYFRAEVYTRGPLPAGSFAFGDVKGKKRALPYLIARQNKAVLGITGDYVTYGGNAKGVMIRQGRVYFDKKQAPTLAVFPDGELKAYEPGEVTAKELLAMGVQDSFAFGPILVKDGKAHPSVASHRLRNHNWRASIGMVEKGHYILIVNPVGVSLMDLAKLYVKENCTVAYNLDGGHSSTIVFMGEQLYKQAPGEDNGEQRSLSDLLTIGMNAAVPGPGAPVYCDGLGYNKKNRPAPTDGPVG